MWSDRGDGCNADSPDVPDNASRRSVEFQANNVIPRKQRGVRLGSPDGFSIDVSNKDVTGFFLAPPHGGVWGGGGWTPPAKARTPPETAKSRDFDDFGGFGGLRPPPAKTKKKIPGT